MKPSLHILHLEDNPSDAELCRRMLTRDGLPAEITVVHDAAGFQTALGRGGFDLILCDYSLPDYDGMSALAASRRIRPSVPFIFVSGELGEEAAIEALKSGATDYVLKVRMTRLVPAVRRALAEAEARLERLRAEETARDRDELLRAVMGSLSAQIAVVDARGAIIAVNHAWTKFGEENKSQEMMRVGVGLNYLEVCRVAARTSPELVPIAAGIESVLQGKSQEFVFEYPCHSPGGQRWFLLYATPLNGGRGGAALSHVDISDRKIAELERRRMEQRLRQTERLVSLGELAASVLSEIELSSPGAGETDVDTSDPIKDFNVLLESYERMVRTVKAETSFPPPEQGVSNTQVNERDMINLCKLLAELAALRPTAESAISKAKPIEDHQQDRLLSALQETVKVLEGTRRSFKSKPLGRLRIKLESLIATPG